MPDPDFLSHLIQLRGDMRSALEESDGADPKRDSWSRRRLDEVEQLIAEMVQPRPRP